MGTAERLGPFSKLGYSIEDLTAELVSRRIHYDDAEVMIVNLTRVHGKKEGKWKGKDASKEASVLLADLLAYLMCIPGGWYKWTGGFLTQQICQALKLLRGARKQEIDKICKPYSSYSFYRT